MCVQRNSTFSALHDTQRQQQQQQQHVPQTLSLSQSTKSSIIKLARQQRLQCTGHRANVVCYIEF